MDSSSYPQDNPYLLWVIDQKGNFRRLYAPFRVQVIRPVGTFSTGTWVYVEKIWESKKCPIIFKVYDKWYCFRHFKIPLN
jgi:hypothetical protein